MHTVYIVYVVITTFDIHFEENFSSSAVFSGSSVKRDVVGGETGECL